jgi:hypothetical protein
VLQMYERASLMNVRHEERQNKPHHHEQKREHSQQEQGHQQVKEHKHHHHHHQHHHHQLTTPDEHNDPAPREHTPPSHKLAIHTHVPFRSRPKRTIMTLMGQVSASPSLVNPPRKIDLLRQQITTKLVVITAKPQVSQSPKPWLPKMPPLTAKRNGSAKRGSVLPLERVTQVRVPVRDKTATPGKTITSPSISELESKIRPSPTFSRLCTVEREIEACSSAMSLGQVYPAAQCGGTHSGAERLGSSHRPSNRIGVWCKG